MQWTYVTVYRINIYISWCAKICPALLQDKLRLPWAKKKKQTWKKKSVVEGAPLTFFIANRRNAARGWEFTGHCDEKVLPKDTGFPETGKSFGKDSVYIFYFYPIFRLLFQNMSLGKFVHRILVVSTLEKQIHPKWVMVTHGTPFWNLCWDVSPNNYPPWN